MVAHEEQTQAHDLVAFPAANDDFRAVRNRCSFAVREFNAAADTANPSLRVELWRDIVDPTRVRESSRSSSGNITLDATFKDPSLKPAAPFVKPPVFIDYGLRLYVGASTFINRNFTVLDTPAADICIGEGCNIGPGVSIYGVTHPLNWRDRAISSENGHSPVSYAKSVRIGNNVFVGGGATIMGGVSIGDGAVIDSCSVVTRDIPAGWLARGSPARPIRLVDEVGAAEAPRTVKTLDEALQYNRSNTCPSESEP